MLIKVNKHDTKELISKNKERHIAEHELQMVAWNKAMDDYSGKLKEWTHKVSKSDKVIEKPHEPIKPESYVIEYDRLLKMLNLHVDVVIQIDTDSIDYAKIFENRFRWSDRFTSITGGYISSGFLNASDKEKIDSI